MRPILDQHAYDEWANRAPAHAPALETAWKESFQVTAPEIDGDSAWLHAPTDMVFPIKGVVLKTVLYADYGRIDTSELLRCAACDTYVAPHHRAGACPWCGEEGIQTAGGVTIRGGGW